MGLKELDLKLKYDSEEGIPPPLVLVPCSVSKDV